MSSSILKLSKLRQHGHAGCVACIHPQLKLDFVLCGPDAMHSSIDFTEEMCSFNGHVHGGVLAFVVDQAVTCMLLAKETYAVTGELNLRYKKPVQPRQTAHVEVALERTCGQLSKVRATVRQGGEDCVIAQASMMAEGLRSSSGA
jgi:acyl-coenzyme A thioesterase PaaI-like protein